MSDNFTLMDIDSLIGRTSGKIVTVERVPSIVDFFRNLQMMKSCGQTGLVEQVVVVVVAAVDKRHDVSQQIVVGKDEFHRNLLANSRSCPTPDVASIGGSSCELTEVTILIAVQISSAILCSYFAINGLIPTETGQFKVGIVVTINSSHTSWSICR